MNEKESYINEHAFDKVEVPLVWLCTLTRFSEYHEIRAKSQQGFSERLLNGYGRDAKDYLKEYIKVIEEELAQTIYNGWKDQEGWVPWVPRGNSLKQGEARRQAQERLEELDNLTKDRNNG